MSSSGTREVLDRMRRDWDKRAVSNAEHFVYTRDSANDEPGFEESGRANYDQLVRPFLPILLAGRRAKHCRVLEIGCGVGRMTQCFGNDFERVDALDISPAMLSLASKRLAQSTNIEWHLGNGETLEALPDGAFDLVFSYIVFQHVPSKEVIATYIREAARVLRSGGVFKFQVNGKGTGVEPDTWTGVSFSLPEIRSLLAIAGFHVLMAEGAGTQYFVLTARRGQEQASTEPRSYILPGESWAEEQMGPGWGELVDGSWRRVESRFVSEVARPRGRGVHFFLGIYFWPEPEFIARTITIGIGQNAPVHVPVLRAGDHYVEIAVPNCDDPAPVRIEIEPPCGDERRPALRTLGLFSPIDSVVGSRA